jgi:hypothetical protein
MIFLIGKSSRNDTSELAMNRRTWLLGLAGSFWAGRVLAQDISAADRPEFSALEQLAKKANIDPFRAQISPHYLGAGDADAAWTKEALKLCEELADDYSSHFRKKGFTVSLPKDRMTVVALGGPESFAAFLGTQPGDDVGGVYDVDTNRLVIFDNRKRIASGQLARANTISLLHEATHQLTFNTGLLERKSDVPLVISEGLGMYGEVRSPKGKVKIGDNNLLRLKVLVDAHPERPTAKTKGKEKPWLTFNKLLTDETLFEDPKERNPELEQLAYAHSWLIVHYLLHSQERLPQFQKYLKTIRARKDKERRLEDAKTAFGDFEVLEKDLRKDFASKRALVKR